MLRSLAFPEILEKFLSEIGISFIYEMPMILIIYYGLTPLFPKNKCEKKWKAKEEKNNHFQLLRNVTQLCNYSKP